MTASGSCAAPTRRPLRAAALAVCLLVLLPSCGDGSATREEPADPAAQPTTPASPTASAPASASASAPASAPTSSSPAAEGSAAAEGTAAEPGGQDDGVRFAVVGDSITAGFAAVEGTTVRDRYSWIPFADTTGQLTFVGGYAVPGATTAVMREDLVTVDADVLVVMAGTNDVGTGEPWETIRDNLLAITAAAGTPVLLSAIPPYDQVAEEVVATNARLAELAAEQGWEFVDPWADLSVDGAWLPGTSEDGIHPVEEVVALVGQRLAAAIPGAAG
ncbi:GDSL-type esterase/lipase family protein [Geodermatophilus sp. DSM 44513]|uniref:SGNH/GDSL hydrolase family protein n=1 Tax=Geodermatophilus sp. DSM 44513 TaxID=1528104 RepID=UPI0014135B30|nr:GDSL-type esterase/lipase family protein [Geodermatophilus sp. DSM 44513]WNV74814.1 GDSL-type esterase/lipase family protein [Geodermatophilus sp. DSM 44513]